MKLLALFLYLFIFSNANAQDYKLIEELKRAENKNRATQLAKQIVAITPIKYRLFSTKESHNAGILRFRFVQAELTDEDLEKARFTEAQRSAFITIDFSFYNAGEDINAARPEFITYKLNEITAAYPELFAIWKNFFKPEAESETTKSDFKSQLLKDPERRIDIQIFHTETGWLLRNKSLN